MSNNYSGKSASKENYNPGKRDYNIGTIANSYNNKVSSSYNSTTSPDGKLNYSASIGALLGAYLSQNASNPTYSKMIGNYINNLVETYTSGKPTKARQEFDFGMMMGLYCGSIAKQLGYGQNPNTQSSAMPYSKQPSLIDQVTVPYRGKPQQVQDNYSELKKDELYKKKNCELCGAPTLGENICKECIEKNKDTQNSYHKIL